MTAFPEPTMIARDRFTPDVMALPEMRDGYDERSRMQVGAPATIQGWSDRHAATVIAISKSGKQISVREDRAIRLDSNGLSESQEYRFEPNPNGRERRFSKRADGRFVEVGQPARSGSRCYVGYRDEYRDPSF
jgi:hypothetical protein